MRKLFVGWLAVVSTVSLAVVGCCKETPEEQPKPVASSPTSSVTAAGSTAPAEAPPAADPLATLLTGEPPAGVTFMRIKAAKGQPISARVPLGWTTSRDDSSIDYVDDEVQLSSKDDHASVWISVGAPIDSLSDKLIQFNTKRVRGSKVTYDAPIEGRFGKHGWEAKIAKGQGQIMKRPAEFWYVLAKTKSGKGVTVFAGARSDVYPKRRDEALAVLRSVFGTE